MYRLPFRPHELPGYASHTERVLVEQWILYELGVELLFLSRGQRAEFAAGGLRLLVVREDEATARFLLEPLDQGTEGHLHPAALHGLLLEHRHERDQLLTGHLLEAQFAQGRIVAPVVADFVEHRAPEQVRASDAPRFVA